MIISEKTAFKKKANQPSSSKGMKSERITSSHDKTFLNVE